MNPIDARATMLSLPECTQSFLTWLTGKALPGQSAMFASTPSIQLVTGLSCLFGGCLASAWLTTAPPSYWPLLLVTWTLTVTGARKLQVVIGHECTHFCVTGVRWKDRFLYEALSTILMIQDFSAYYNDHIGLHHSKKLASLDDPDLKLLMLLGFKPGGTREQYWANLRRTTVSPLFHLRLLFYRARANFYASPPYRKVMAVTYHLAVLAGLYVTRSWIQFVIGWILPVMILYQVSALFQFLSEHRWLLIKRPNEADRIYLARLTVGRFLGESYPLESGMRAKLYWATKMLTYHLFCRVFVLMGDLPVHDFHHRHPASKDWPYAIYARQQDVDSGCPGWPQYSEVWGLTEAINSVFAVLSSLPQSCDLPRMFSEELATAVFSM